MLVKNVLDDGEPLEHLLDRSGDSNLAANDHALARAIASTTLRRKGQIDKVISSLMQKPLGKRGGIAMHILRIATAQILFMDVPDHASVSLAMDLAKADHKARHFSKLINGVLRALTREREQIVAGLKARDVLPNWLAETWAAAYGANTRDEIAAALCHNPYLDINAKKDASVHAKALKGKLLPTGSIRLNARGMIPSLPGFREGAWWVQDTAATLAPILLGDVHGKRVVDLCAAPGGKSAFLAARGAKVTAVDISVERLGKLRDNLNRLDLDASIIEADIMTWQPTERFDHVLLDAPCSATGTARKHPDVLWLKTPEQVTKMALIQRALLKKAVEFLSPAGTLVFCTCSLQPQEGEAIIDFIKAEKLPLALVPVEGAEIGGMTEVIRPDGTLRTLPSHLAVKGDSTQSDDDSILAGLDGFFIARFRRN